jgi:hypothetical protein
LISEDLQLLENSINDNWVISYSHARAYKYIQMCTHAYPRRLIHKRSSKNTNIPT